MATLREIKYLTDEHLLQLEKDVNEYIKAGWTVIGSVKHFADKTMGPMAQGTVFCQAIGRYEDTIEYREGSDPAETVQHTQPL